MVNNYDVIVIGGGTAGCAAAYTAGKLGLKTLLLEEKIHLGGAITSGLVVPVMNAGSHQINTDFYNYLTQEMKTAGGQFSYDGNQGWFNPELMKIVLDKMMADAGVEVLFNSSIINAKTENRKIISVLPAFDTSSNPMLSPSNDTIYTDKSLFEYSEILSPYIEAKYIVDATGDANFCKKINCEFLNDSKDFQPMSLRFIMSGVDLEAFADWIYEYDTDRSVTTVQKSDGQIHFSTAYTWDKGKKWALAPIFDEAVRNNELKDTDRNYFQIFTIAGMPSSVAFNCPRIAEKLNPTDTASRTKVLIEARAAIFRLSKFCKKHFKGFENAYISNIADDLGVRVSNRIKGKYVYTIEDLKSGKKFEHPAVISNYPVDVHSSDKESSTLQKTGEYQLPVESLMSADYENLFVAGRCLSADYMSQGALRVQSSCFAMGEAVAKYIAKII